MWLRGFTPLTLSIWAALGVVLAAAVMGRWYFGIPWNRMMDDPAAATDTPFYLGFVSNVGILLWAAAASAYLFSFWVHRSGAGDPEWGGFLLCSGLLTALLGVDDLFMLHDEVFSDYLGIREWITTAV